MDCISTKRHLPRSTEGIVELYLPASDDQEKSVCIIPQGQHTSPNKHHRQKKPHKKSRRGCINCKARKVKVRPRSSSTCLSSAKVAKCQETRPACANCITRDMDCMYQGRSERQRARKELSAAADAQEPLPSPTPPRKIFGAAFTGDDLRFFHHFLLVARPHLPFGSEGSWTTQVPTYAHEVSCSHRSYSHS